MGTSEIAKSIMVRAVAKKIALLEIKALSKKVGYL
jgi:hypothetical protein